MARTHVGGVDVDGSTLALTDGSTNYTWSELLAEAVPAGNAMRGSSRGGRIAIIGANSAQTLLGHLAAALAGVSSVGVNARLTVEEIAYILRDSNSTLCVLPSDRLADVGAAARELGCRVIHTDGPVDDPESWSTLVSEGDDIWSGDHPAEPLVLYTSGTSGFPKGTHARWVADPGTTVESHLAAIREAMANIPAGPNLVCGPLHHNGPLMGLRCLLVGSPVVVLPRFTGEAALEAIATYGIVSAVVVPTHLIRMLAVPEEIRSATDVSSIRYLVLTGAACPRDVKKSVIDWFGPVVTEAYGGTESGIVCTITSAEWLERPASVGRTVARFSPVVVDDDDTEVAAGTVGRLYFRDETGRGITYLGDPEKTAKAHLRPGVFTLGEVGFVDEDGYVHITDRSVDMVLSGGVNIYPAEIERVLGTHPAVADVAVIGVPDPEMGERLLALIAPADPDSPPLPEELEDHCRLHLAGYKCPRSYVNHPGLTRDHMGKLDKKALRREYASSNQNERTTSGEKVD